MKRQIPVDAPLIVETAPTWVPWAVLGILGLAGMATLGLRTTHEALSRDRVLGGGQETSSSAQNRSAEIPASLVELRTGLVDQADRS